MNAKSVHARGLRELLLSLGELYAFVCRDCSHRFLARLLHPRDIAFAKCPRCLRMDLTTWDPKHYHSGFGVELAVFLGGNRWRCEPCRCNFVSWFPRRLRYAKHLLPAAGQSEEAMSSCGRSDGRPRPDAPAAR